jgi:hypothetical protein
VKSQRECLGYGVQLSWPKDGDKKRALVVSNGDARRRQHRGVNTRARFVNVRSWDVALALAVELENGIDHGKSVIQVAGAVSYCPGAGRGTCIDLLTMIPCSSLHAIDVYVHGHAAA